MNICFLSNFSKTKLFHEIALLLKEKNIHTYWIATNKSYYNYLIERYDEDRILYLNRKLVNQAQATIHDFRLNEIIYGDRVLRYEPEAGLQFLSHIQQPIYDFFKNNKVRFVFGEITWAHEVLIHRLSRQCSELNTIFLNPHVVRIPDSRFAFFEDERQSKVLRLLNKQAWNGKAIVPKKPAYLKINDKKVAKARSVNGRLGRIKRFFTNESIDDADPTLLANSYWRIRTRSREEINRETYKLIHKNEFDFLDNPYVFLGLHKQPEASVDVFGRYYEDQLQNIKNLWRSLPEGWLLVIKEHSNAIGDRAANFYRTIQKLPNVCLVSEHAKTYDIIRGAKLVATITGTIAYEAALMKIPSVTFAPVFFNQLQYCRQITLEDLDQEGIKCFVEPDESKLSIVDFSKWLYQNSLPGKMIDPQSDPTVLEADNVRLLADGIHQAINTYCVTVPQ